MGHVVQRVGVRSRIHEVLNYQQEPPFQDATQAVRLVTSSPPLSSWPLFAWSLVSSAVHSPGRAVTRQDVLAPRLPWRLPRGKYHTQLRLELTDALGLTLWRSRQEQTIEVVVHGLNVAQPAPTPPALRTAQSGPRRAPRREGEALDVRLYHAGDDMRRLHWALWAHSGEAWLRIPDPTPPPSGRKVWVVDVSMPVGFGPDDGEAALDARLAPLRDWILSSPHWLLVVPALGLSCREAGELPLLLASAHVAPLPVNPDLSWSRGLTDSIVVVSGPACPGAEALKQALEPRRRIKVVVLPFPERSQEPGRTWWKRR